MTTPVQCPSFDPDRDCREVTPRLRLEFLDGLRGLAALYVLLYHSLTPLIYLPDLSRTVSPGVMRFLRGSIDVFTAHYAVDVFIILSGYCLMLPVARSTDGRLPGGVWKYLGRRARRILPPFYAALCASVLCPIVWQWLTHAIGRAPGETRWHLFQTLLSANIGSKTDFFMHLLLLHNLNPAWICSYSVPFWSVAPEWQFYFLLPALLLPLWRRFGAAVAVCCAFLLSAAPHFFLPSTYNLDWTLPWLFGLFALGMAAAVLSVSAKPREVAWRQRVPWGKFALALFSVQTCFLFLCPHPMQDALRIYPSNILPRDVLAGIIGASGILYCFRRASQQCAVGRPLILRLLESRWAVRLGAFSYSLYLTHVLILLMPLDPIRMVRVYHLSAFEVIAVRGLIGVPAALAFAYLFHLVFERPFMASRPNARRSEDAGGVAKMAVFPPALSPASPNTEAIRRKRAQEPQVL